MPFCRLQCGNCFDQQQQQSSQPKVIRNPEVSTEVMENHSNLLPIRRNSQPQNPLKRIRLLETLQTWTPIIQRTYGAPKNSDRKHPQQKMTHVRRRAHPEVRKHLCRKKIPALTIPEARPAASTSKPPVPITANSIKAQPKRCCTVCYMKFPKTTTCHLLD